MSGLALFLTVFSSSSVVEWTPTGWVHAICNCLPMNSKMFHSRCLVWVIFKGKPGFSGWRWFTFLLSLKHMILPYNNLFMNLLPHVRTAPLTVRLGQQWYLQASGKYSMEENAITDGHANIIKHFQRRGSTPEMPSEWTQHWEPHQCGAIMNLTPGFSLAVTIAESWSIQLAITLERDRAEQIQWDRQRESQFLR